MKIVIPKINTSFRRFIKEGSGIVMIENKIAPEIPIIYYEGNLYNAVNLRSYRDRIVCAAGRAHHKYPTIAMQGVLQEFLDDFVHVGNCHLEEGYRINFYPSVEALIEEWIYPEVL